MTTILLLAASVATGFADAQGLSGPDAIRRALDEEGRLQEIHFELAVTIHQNAAPAYPRLVSEIGDSGILNIHWKKDGLFSIDVVKDNQKVRTLYADEKFIHAGDGEKWPLAYLAEIPDDEKEWDAYHAAMWPWIIAKRHLYPFSRGTLTTVQYDKRYLNQAIEIRESHDMPANFAGGHDREQAKTYILSAPANLEWTLAIQPRHSYRVIGIQESLDGEVIEKCAYNTPQVVDTTANAVNPYWIMKDCAHSFFYANGSEALVKSSIVRIESAVIADRPK